MNPYENMHPGSGQLAGHTYSSLPVNYPTVDGPIENPNGPFPVHYQAPQFQTMPFPNPRFTYYVPENSQSVVNPPAFYGRPGPMAFNTHRQSPPARISKVAPKFGKPRLPFSNFVGKRSFSGNMKAKTPTKPIFCELCRVSCAGPKSLLVHEQGQRHQKNLKNREREKTTNNNTEINVKQETNNITQHMDASTTNDNNKSNQPPPSPFYCSLCVVDCSGQQSYDEHLGGRAHARKVKLFIELGKPVPPSLMVTDPVFAKKSGANKVNDSGDPKAVKSQNEASSNVPSVGAEYIVKVNDTGGKGLVYHCQLCDCSLTSGSSQSLHLSGRRHIVNYKQKVDPSYKVPWQNNANNQRRKGVSEQQRLSMMASNLPPPMLTHQPVMHFLGQQAGSPPSVKAPSPIYAADNRVINVKHANISPEVSELRFIRLTVSNCEQALRNVNDKLNVTTDNSPANDSSATEQQQQQQQQQDKDKQIKRGELRYVRGTVRVGPLGMRLLLRGESTGELVLRCAQWPTHEFAAWLASHLPDLLKEIDPSINYTIKWDASKERLVVKCRLPAANDVIKESTKTPATNKNTDSKCELAGKDRSFDVYIRLTSPAVLKSSDGDAKSNNSDKKNDKDTSSTKGTVEGSGTELNGKETSGSDTTTSGPSTLGDQLFTQPGFRSITKQSCIQSLQMLDQVKWYQSVVNFYPLAMVSRILRNFIYTTDEWAEVDEFSLLALLDRLLSVEFALASQSHYAVSHMASNAPLRAPFTAPFHQHPRQQFAAGCPPASQLVQVAPGRLLRCFFEAIAGGGLFQPLATGDDSNATSEENPPSRQLLLHPLLTLVKSDAGDSDQVVASRKHRLTACAQTILRQIANKQLYKILGVEPPSTPTPGKRDTTNSGDAPTPMAVDEQPSDGGKDKSLTDSGDTMTIAGTEQVDDNHQPSAPKRPRTRSSITASDR